MKESMKMKKILMLLAVVIAGFVTMPNVHAAQTKITSENKTLTITREVRNVTNPVTNTFSYTVTADQNNPAAVTGLPAAKATTVVFTNTNPDANHVATATGTLDLSNVTFTKLGDYKFIVTETASTDSTTYPLDDSEYYVYVSVRNVLDANNTPTGEFEATLVEQAKKDDVGNKMDLLYVSSSVHTYIEISKAVKGNMADIDEYFAFTVNIPGATGDVYKIVGDHSTDGTTTVDTSNYVVGTTTTIYLKHGQTVRIGDDGTNYQIPIGSEVTVTETGATDYTTTVNGTSGKGTGQKTLVATTAQDFSTENTYNFINEKTEATLTGMFINILPFVILFLVGIIGIYYIKKSSTFDEA